MRFVSISTISDYASTAAGLLHMSPRPSSAIPAAAIEAAATALLGEPGAGVPGLAPRAEEVLAGVLGLFAGLAACAGDAPALQRRACTAQAGYGRQAV
jgi:hypothetical protein